MIKAIIFDLDGVLVTTDELHFEAWKELSNILGIEGYTRADNMRQRGVSRMESLDIVLEKSDRQYTYEEKLELSNIKNKIYLKMLESLSKNDVLPGVSEFISYIKKRGIKTAVGSASKNTWTILEKTQLCDKFDAVSCGLDTSRSKPDPDVFLIAARKLGIAPEECAVIEDSDAGIKAATAGGMYAIAVGAAADNPMAYASASSVKDLYRIIKLFV